MAPFCTRPLKTKPNKRIKYCFHAFVFTLTVFLTSSVSFSQWSLIILGFVTDLGEKIIKRLIYKRNVRKRVHINSSKNTVEREIGRSCCVDPASLCHFHSRNKAEQHLQTRKMKLRKTAFVFFFFYPRWTGTCFLFKGQTSCIDVCNLTFMSQNNARTLLSAEIQRWVNWRDFRTCVYLQTPPVFQHSVLLPIPRRVTDVFSGCGTGKILPAGLIPQPSQDLVQYSSWRRMSFTAL